MSLCAAKSSDILAVALQNSGGWLTQTVLKLFFDRPTEAIHVNTSASSEIACLEFRPSAKKQSQFYLLCVDTLVLETNIIIIIIQHPAAGKIRKIHTWLILWSQTIFCLALHLKSGRGWRWQLNNPDQKQMMASGWMKFDLCLSEQTSAWQTWKIWEVVNYWPLTLSSLIYSRVFADRCHISNCGVCFMIIW